MQIKFLGVSLVAAAFLGVSGQVAAATFKMAIGDAQGGTQWELATAFKKALESKTDRKTKVSLFPNG